MKNKKISPIVILSVTADQDDKERMQNTKCEMTIRNAKCEMRNQSGFSLIELLFAMSFLTVIILGVVSLQTSNLAMMGGNNNQIQAHFLANQGAQIVKGIGYNASLFSTCATKDSPCIKYIGQSNNSYTIDDSAESPIDNLFNRKVEISSDGLTNAYKATVIVEWTDATGEHLKKDGAHVKAELIVSKP